MEILRELLLCVIPIFVAIDAIGVMPFFVNLTVETKEEDIRKIAFHSVLTAFLVALFVMFLGETIFTTLGIKITDFMIAGGILLLVISINDIIREKERVQDTNQTFGVVPIGTPLLAGPATLTTILVLVGSYGSFLVIVSLIINLFFAWLIFSQAKLIIKIIGINGTKAIAKVMALFLAAIAVKLIRTGILG